jgi:hypothetical protein
MRLISPILANFPHSFIPSFAESSNEGSGSQWLGVKWLGVKFIFGAAKALIIG